MQTFVKLGYFDSLQIHEMHETFANDQYFMWHNSSLCKIVKPLTIYFMKSPLTMVANEMFLGLVHENHQVI